MTKKLNPKKKSKRPLGFLRGEIWIAPDFNAPMELVEDGEGMALVPASQTATSKSKKGNARKAARKTTRR